MPNHATYPGQVPLLLCYLISVLSYLRPVTAAGISVDLNNTESVKKAASTVAYDLVTFYTGNNTGDVPGNLPDPYYWWEAGAFFGTLINYWAYTNDSTYNDITTQAMLHQAGTNGDFMPSNQTSTEGNDDQCFWALSAMIAAERNFPNPPDDDPQWLSMVQAVFSEMADRWDNSKCGGGLRWQIYTWNAGYTYKNSISNGCFFDIAARLARYTGNSTYEDWAVKAWDWVDDVGLLGDKYQVYDGSSDTTNCSSVDHNQWSYNNGIFLHGAAVMYNYTSNSTWKTRVDNLLSAGDIFFSPNASTSNIMYEYMCEMASTCDTDQLSFKAYLARWLADTAQLAPHTYNTIMTKLSTSASAALTQCIGGDTGTYCGSHWTTGSYDGTTGVGQQMAALEVLQGTLAAEVEGPLTNTTGGTSKGDYSAGTGDSKTDDSSTLFDPVTTGDRVGAAFVTIFVAGCIFGGVALLVF